MEAVIFVGIQATGKSSFYKARFFNTHVRINLDMLKTRHREKTLLRCCLAMQQRFVVDNTNPTVEERAKYIAMAKSARFRVSGYYFRSSVVEAIERNNHRASNERVPPKGIAGTHKRLQIPTFEEGFEALYHVRIDGNGEFLVEEWVDEI